MRALLPILCVAAGAVPAPTQEPAPALDLLAEARRRIPRQTFDLHAVVHAAGKEPDALLEWVKAHTAPVPYRGLLRGPVGVLMDRRGSALDRAVLLYALLGAAGVEARLVQGSLRGGTARRAAAAYRQLPPAGGASDAEYRAAVAAVLKEFAAEHPEHRRDLEDYALADVNHAWRQAEDLAQRVAEQSEALRAAVGAREVHVEVPAAVVADHWWVEWRAGAGGAWQVLDPVFGDLDATAREQLRVRDLQPGSYADLGVENLHRVAIRLVIECWDDGELHDFTVLDQEVLPAAHWRKPIELFCAPTRWPAPDELTKAEDWHRALREAALANGEWVPKLRVGEDTVHKYSFTADGRVSDATLPGYVQYVMDMRKLGDAVGEGAKGLGDRIAGMMSGKKKPDEPPRRRIGKTVTAAWIEYAIRTPDGEPRTMRRALFDGIGRARRAARPVPEPRDPERLALERALALLGTTQIHLETCRPSLAFVEYERAGNTLNRMRELRAVLAGDRTAAVRPFASRRPLELAYARGAHGAASRELFVASPGILTFHSLMQPDAAGLLGHVRGFDIVADGLRAHPAAEGAFGLRLEQGVLDTCLEALAMQPAGDVENAAELFARADGWVTLDSVDDPDWESLHLSEDWLLVLREQVAGGAVVHAPTRPVGNAAHYAWWRVDPATGATLGYGSRGWGQGAVEGTMVLREVSIPQVKRTMTYVTCLNKNVMAGKGPMQANVECLCKTWGSEIANYLKGKLFGKLGDWTGDDFSPVESAIDNSGLGPAEKLAAGEVWDQAKGKGTDGMPDPAGDAVDSACEKLGGGLKGR